MILGSGALRAMGRRRKKGAPVAGGLDIGFDFRATAGYATDPTNCYGVLATGSTYPATFGSVTAGWTPNSTAVAHYDRSNTVTDRLRGIHAINATGYAFRVDGLLGKTIEIRLALGDAAGSDPTQFNLYDGPITGTAFASMAKVNVSAHTWYDATGVLRTSDTDWLTNNAAVTHTFTNDYLMINIPWQSGDIAYVIAHARLTQI